MERHQLFGSSCNTFDVLCDSWGIGWTVGHEGGVLSELKGRVLALLKAALGQGLLNTMHLKVKFLFWFSFGGLLCVVLGGLLGQSH